MDSNATWQNPLFMGHSRDISLHFSLIPDTDWYRLQSLSSFPLCHWTAWALVFARLCHFDPGPNKQMMAAAQHAKHYALPLQIHKLSFPGTLDGLLGWGQRSSLSHSTSPTFPSRKKMEVNGSEYFRFTLHADSFPPPPPHTHTSHRTSMASSL